MSDVLRSRQFDTVLGRIGLDEKGRRHGLRPVAMDVWQADGTYVPLEAGIAKQ